jgi:hypothetical protein
MPNSSSVYQPQGSMIWTDYDNNKTTFVFIDSPTGSYPTSSSIYTSRTVTLNYICSSYTVTSTTTGSLEVETIGNVSLSQVAPPNSITFFTNPNNNCGSPRCSIVEAFETNDNSTGWYYKCNLTLDHTENDPRNISSISDNMAQIATNSIAQVGYTDPSGQAAQTYPHDSPWGIPLDGSEQDMGSTMAIFSMG